MKKTIISLAVLGVALTTSAFAGGYAPAPQHGAMTPYYIEGMVGAAKRTNFPGVSHIPSTDLDAGSKNLNWGWTLGAAIGYNFNKALAAELGGFWVSSATLAVNSLSLKYHNWLGYVAGRFTVPLMDNLDIFAKAGLAWNHLSVSGDSISIPGAGDFDNSNANGFAPIFGVGLGYNFSDNLYLTGAYTYVNSSWNQQVNGSLGLKSPKTAAMQLLTVGLGYRFSM